MSGLRHRRTLVSTYIEENSAYQLFGPLGSYYGSENVCMQHSVLLKLDNSSAVAYINNHSGTISKKLVSLTWDLWMRCQERNIHIRDQYLPDIQNCTANRESRLMRDRSDWKAEFPDLSPNRQMLQTTGSGSICIPTNQTMPTLLYSWRPDPFAETINAFLHDWAMVRGICQPPPPWSLLPQVLNQAQTQEAE